MRRLHQFLPLLPVVLGLGLGLLAPQAHADLRPQWMQVLAPALSGVVNINEATAEQLTLLPGIGPATAAKIIEYRTRRPFRRVTHLMRVKGIGSKTFRRLEPYLRIEGPTTLHELLDQLAARP